MKAVMQKIRKLDVYPRTLEDYKVRTYSGAIVSIICILITAWLFISEISSYLETDVHPALLVDSTDTEKLRINIDILFYDLPCSYLSLDAMDVTGDQQLDVLNNIFKKRIDKNGKTIGTVERETLSTYNVVEDEEFKKKLTEKKPEEEEEEKCGSCYGAEANAGDCCNTCEEVREAYRNQGWAFAHPETIAQCVDEGWSQKMEAQLGEGCKLYGHLEVNKVAGNFHFAPGKSFQQHHMHVHDLEPFKLNSFNVSHKINRLSFGRDFPGVVNPLDGADKVSEMSGMFNYHIQVVPTVYTTLDGSQIKSNQYSVTENFRPIDAPSKANKHAGLPGVFFNYDLSPIMVTFTERSRSLSHLFTGICAIVGGIFTVSGLIDSMIYKGIGTLSKKRELGKLG